MMAWVAGSSPAMTNEKRGYRISSLMHALLCPGATSTSGGSISRARRHGVAAAGAEDAAGGRIERARDLAGTADGRAALLRVRLGAASSSATV